MVGVQYYSYLTDKSYNSNHIIIQAESIYLDNKRRDIVVIDEIKSAINQFNSPYHKENLNLNRLGFENYIKNAKYLLILDADLDEICIKVINHIRNNESIILYHNIIQKRSDYTLFEFTNKIDFYYKIIESKMNNEKIIIVTSNYTEGKIIENYCGFQGNKHRYYSAEEDNLPEEIKNINNIVSQLDSLIYISTLSNGVNININHFDKIFVFIVAKSNCARELKQMIGRIRNLNHKQIYYFVNSQIRYKPDIYEKVKLDINNHLQRANINAKEIIHNFISLTDIYRKDIQNNYKFYIKNTIWTYIGIYNIIEKNKSWNNIAQEFLSVILPQGYQYIILESNIYNEQEIQEFYKLLKEIKIAYKQNNLKEQQNARILVGNNLIQHKKLLQNSEATKNEKIQITKSELINKFQDNIDITLLDPLYNDKYNKLLNKIYSIYFEIKYNNNNNLFFYDKYKIIKLPIVDKVCQILQIQNSIDIHTEINLQNIIPYCKEIYYSYFDWKKIFNFRCKIPDLNYKDYLIQSLQVLRSIIKNQDCKIQKSGQNAGFKYKLILSDNSFSELVN